MTVLSGKRPVGAPDRRLSDVKMTDDEVEHIGHTVTPIHSSRMSGNLDIKYLLNPSPPLHLWRSDQPSAQVKRNRRTSNAKRARQLSPAGAQQNQHTDNSNVTHRFPSSSCCCCGDICRSRSTTRAAATFDPSNTVNKSSSKRSLAILLSLFAV